MNSNVVFLTCNLSLTIVQDWGEFKIEIMFINVKHVLGAFRFWFIHIFKRLHTTETCDRRGVLTLSAFLFHFSYVFSSPDTFLEKMVLQVLNIAGSGSHIYFLTCFQCLISSVTCDSLISTKLEMYGLCAVYMQAHG